MRKLLLIFLLIPCLAYAADTSIPYGGIEFNNETAGYTGTISAPTANTYYGFINATATDLNGFTFNNDDTNGDYLELTGVGGTYLVWGGMSFALASPSGEDVHCEVFKNNTGIDSAFERIIAAGMDIGGAPLTPDTVTLATGDKLRVKCETDSNSKTVNVYHLGMFVKRLLTIDADSENAHTHREAQIIPAQTGTPCYGCN